MDELKKLIQALYFKDAEKITKQVMDEIKKYPKVENQNISEDWYKFLSLYTIYPDGVAHRHRSAIDSLIPHFDRVKDLGCTAVHILPFLESPMIDKGFDVSDFYKIRPELGTLNDLKKLKKHGDELGIHVFMDLVFNHVSDKHEWFEKAQSGDEKYRNYFLNSKEKPNFIRKFQQNGQVIAEYQVGKDKKQVPIVFPERTGEIPHWRQGKDGYWYYHTFYPEQLDIDWYNPDVFLECVRIMLYWTSLGFNFRIDALPYIGVGGYKELGIKDKKTAQVMRALNCIAKQVNPQCAFIIEIFTDVDVMIRLFGTSNVRQTELSYDFPLSTYLWLSIVKQDATYIWKQLEDLSKIPVHAEWINFLRNHDELSLSNLTDQLKDDVSKELLPRGAVFREGWGISGRTFSFIGEKIKKFMMAYFLLTSMPGGMAIPYGDEIGKKNIPLNRLTPQNRTDTRNINRGVLTQQESKLKRATKIFTQLKSIVQLRQSILHSYINIYPKPLNNSNKGLVVGVYQAGASELIILVNLTDKSTHFKYNLEDFKIVSSVNHVKQKKNIIYLGPYAGVWLQK